MLMDIDKALQAFDARDLNAFKIIMNIIGHKKLDLGDVMRYINIREMAIGIDAYYPCKACASPMMLELVNNQPCNQVGEDLKTQWFCNHCGESEFSQLDIDEQMARTIIYNHRMAVEAPPVKEEPKTKECGGCNKHPQAVGQFHGR